VNRATHRRGRGEDGASLLIAIAFMLVFALLVTALLQFSVTSFQAANVVVERSRASYAADGAVDTLVQRVRRDPNMNIGRTGQACDDVTFSGADSSTPSATASCAAQTNSGAVRPGMDNYPANAILTTGAGGITASGSGRIKTNANVYSDGGITLNNGAVMDAYDNAVTARQACTPTPPGSQWVTVKAQCGAPNTAPQYNDGADPGWTSQIAGTMRFNPTPDCGFTVGGRTLSNITVFHPGYYTKPKLLTSAKGSCAAGYYWFEPGVYYFNLSTRGGDTWDVNGIVGGGVPLSSYSGSFPAPGANATQPVACDLTASGVQFVFGGDTQIRLATSANGTGISSLELCPRTEDANRIAIYGALVQGGSADPQTFTMNPSNYGNNTDYTVNTGACTPTGAVPSCTLGQGGSVDPNTSPIDTRVATVCASGGGCLNGNPPQATISWGPSSFDWSAFDPATYPQIDVPAGLQITGIDVHVRHQEPSSKQVPNVTISALTSNGNSVDCQVTTLTPGNNTPTYYDETKPCVGGLTDGSNLTATKGQGANHNDFAKSLTVTYTVGTTDGRKNTLTQNPPSLDGLQVILKTTPVVLPQNGCVTALTCSFLSNLIGASGHAGIWGNLYAPNAGLGVSGGSLDFGSAANIVFNRGVIVSSMDLVGLPDANTDTKGRFRLGDGTGRTVVVTSSSGRQKVRALVRVVDSATASPHGFLAVIRQWSTRP